MNFKVGDFVRCNCNETQVLLKGAVYRVASRFNDEGVTLENETGWHYDTRFIPWVPQTGDYVTHASSDYPGDFLLLEQNQHGDWNTLSEQGQECWYAFRPDGPIPVLNRAPYCETEKVEFDLRGKSPAEAIKEIAAKAKVEAYTPVFNPAGMPSTPTPETIQFAPEAEPITVPIGSTPTAEKMRREFEAKRDLAEAEQRMRAKEKCMIDIHEHILFCEKESGARGSYLALVKTKGPF